MQYEFTDAERMLYLFDKEFADSQNRTKEERIEAARRIIDKAIEVYNKQHKLS